jgi:hypothetical protein
VLGLSAGSGALYPCGGPESYPIDAPLVKPHAYLESLLATDYATGQRREEIRFLYPFKLARPREVAGLWSLAYLDPFAPAESVAVGKFHRTDSGALDQALAKGDVAMAEAEAQRIVAEVLDMPAIMGDSNQPAFRRAIEFLELRSRLTGVPAARVAAVYDSLAAPVRSLARADMPRYAEAHPADPRIASLRFVALEEARKREIPNGWPEEIRQQMTPEGWRRLEELHDGWLRDFPHHPLADLVTLSRLRLFYFEEQTGRAWQVLLGMYPRHLPRLLAEMRFLITNGGDTPVLDSVVLRPDLDPVLRTAVLGELPATTLTPDQWNRLWELSAAHIKEPWAINLEERLLQKVVEQPESLPFPKGFPTGPANPSGLWGYLRLLALTQTRHTEQALEQGKSLKPTEEVAAVMAKLYLGRGEWTRATTVPGLEPHARRYLLWVMAPDSALGRVAAGSDSAAHEARLVEATRRVRQDGWAAGARVLEAHEPDAAAIWHRAGALASDTSLDGRLAYARFLRDQAGRLYLGKDIVWYRSVSYRLDLLTAARAQEFDTGLPWRPTEESEAIHRHLLESSAEYEALRGFAEYLNRAPAGSRDYSTALKEGDRLYNTLLNWGQSQTSFWSSYLPHSPEAAAIRKAGKGARGP